MLRRILNFDVETTGLNPESDAVVSLSGQTLSLEDRVLTIDKIFDYRLSPHEGANIDEKAMEINGLVDIENFPDAKDVVRKFKLLLGNNKFSRWDGRYFLMGYNLGFDKAFLESLFRRYSDQNLVEYTNFYIIDVFGSYSEMLLHSERGSKETSNLKLSTLAKDFNIQTTDHNSLSDSLTTLSLWVWQKGISGKIDKVRYNGKTLYNLKHLSYEVIDIGSMILDQ